MRRIRSDLTYANVSAALAFFLALGVAGALAAAPSVTASANNPIFGRWQQTHKCTWLVHALKEDNLRPLAPAVVGDYFPNKTPHQLAQKRHICRGAEPQRHSHFFTRDGRFGSVDQNGQQVDDGAYRIIDPRTVHIGDVRLHFQVDRTAQGKVLALKPVITRRMRRVALAHPLRFSRAAYAEAVAYTGHGWNRVPCGMWC